MGTDWSAVLLYGVVISKTQEHELLQRLFGCNTEEERFEWIGNYGWNSVDAKYKDVRFVEVYWYDNDQLFLAINTTIHHSKEYSFSEINRFIPTYEIWDEMLSEFLRHPVQGKWWLMPNGM